jgi:type II secretory pathway pseudopilin PulG
MGVAIAIIGGFLVSVLLPFLVSSKEAQDKARARRMAEHRMNARLLRLNL